MFFDILLFFVPVLSLIKTELIYLVPVLMAISTTPRLFKYLKNKKISEESEQIANVIHPLKKETVFFITLFVGYQLMSALLFGITNPSARSQIGSDLLIIMLESFCLLISTATAYLLTNYPQHDMYAKSQEALAKGLIFACIIMIIDFLSNHKMLGFISSDNILHVSANKNFTTNTGRMFCLSIIWIPISEMLISDKKRWSVALFACGALMAITPTLNQGQAHTSIYMFLIGIATFATLTKFNKHAKPIAIVSFWLMLLSAIIIFVLLNPEYFGWMFSTKNTASYELCAWTHYAKEMWNRPVFGHGFNFVEKMGPVSDCSFSDFIALAQIKADNTYYNAGLQITLELGFVGLLFFGLSGTAIILQVLSRQSFIAKKNTMAILNAQKFMRSGCLAGLFSAMSSTLFTQSVWSGWIMMSVIFVATLHTVSTIRHYNKDHSGPTTQDQTQTELEHCKVTNIKQSLLRILRPQKPRQPN